jgi:hypothetical protein
MSVIIINRIWEMPNKYTFKMKCVQELFARYSVGINWVDPFAGMYSPAQTTNDIEPESTALSHEDGFLFLRSCATAMFDGALFDPPYSPDQCLRIYKPISRNGKKSWGTGGKATYHADCRNEIAG